MCKRKGGSMMAEAISQFKITDAEWEVMRVVWANGIATSRLIIDILEDKQSWKTSTIKTLIGRLVDKGALDAQLAGRKFIYSAVISENEIMRDFTTNLLSRICNKKLGNVLVDILSKATLSQGDISELIYFLEEKKMTAPLEVACGCVPGQCECHLNTGGDLK